MSIAFISFALIADGLRLCQQALAKPPHLPSGDAKG
jgi:hypothetical protein